MRKKAVKSRKQKAFDAGCRFGTLRTVNALEADMNRVATKGFLEIGDVWEWANKRREEVEKNRRRGCVNERNMAQD
jgi:hypothetical protein